MTNSPRLKAVESLVPNGTRLLDIGSDHGFLPISLFAQGKLTAAVLTDINKGPLESSRRNMAAACGNKNVQFYLSDGFEKVPHGCYDLAAICGMGGELIARIIKDGGSKAHCDMILQPMSQQEKLRAFLWENGYTIEAELYPTEGKRSYVVMKVRYTGVPTKYTEVEAYLGKVQPQTEGYKAYAAKIAAAAEKRLKGAEISGDTKTAETARAVITAATDLCTALP